MRKSWFEYGEFTSQSLYNVLSEKEKQHLQRFKDYLLISASEGRAKESLREILRFKRIVGKDLFSLDLEDLRYFLKELKQSPFADHTKNKIKGYVQRFLRWGFKDWSERFDEFEDIKFNSDAQNKKLINAETILTTKDIEKLLEAEPSLYWKTFLMTQAEAGLRTKEARELTWDKVDFEDDGFTTLNIPSKKNQTGTTKINPVVVKIAGNFLKALKEEQRKREIKSPYVFPSPANPNKPISKAVNLWFNSLCKKALGREGNNYLLRHAKGTALQEKVRKGELSKDNAITFMRHSEKMFDKIYSHMSKEDIKSLIKKQVYNTQEFTKEEKGELVKMKKEVQLLKQQEKETAKVITEILNKLEQAEGKKKKYSLIEIPKK